MGMSHARLPQALLNPSLEDIKIANHFQSFISQHCATNQCLLTVVVKFKKKKKVLCG